MQGPIELIQIVDAVLTADNGHYLDPIIFDTIKYCINATDTLSITRFDKICGFKCIRSFFNEFEFFKEVIEISIRLSFPKLLGSVLMYSY